MDAASVQLMDLARDVYKTFFSNFKDLPTAKYKIEHWDAGWWQIKKCITEAGLEQARIEEIDKLRNKLGAEISEEALDLRIITSV